VVFHFLEVNFNFHFVTSITPFIMNSSQLSKENYDIMIFKAFDKLKNAKNSKVSHKELKKVKQEKESLIVQLSKSHVLIDSLKSENTMLFNTIDAVSLYLATFCWTKSLLCKDAFYQGFCYSEVSPEDSAQFASQKFRFPASRPDAQLSNPSVVQTTCQTVRTPIRLKHHLSRPSSVSRSFELLQLASIQTIQQLVQTILSVRSSLRISFQNPDMGKLLQPFGRRGF